MPTNPAPGDEPQHYEIEIKKEAEKAMRRLPRDLRNRITAAILKLADHPRPNGCTKIAGHDILYRVRVGDWRITYAIYEGLLLIVIVEVKPRGGAYRGL